jgi:TPR repeat protein
MKIYLSIILLSFLSSVAHSNVLLDGKLELAEQGDAETQYNLALMYINGKGVPKHDKTAVMWYTKAAEQGNAMAQAGLGLMYVNGKGVPESNIKAYVWWSMAKASGNEIAKGNLEKLKKAMIKEQIAKAQEIGSRCYASDYKDCD